MSVLVIAEQRDGTLNRATWEAIAAAQQAGGPVRVALLGTSLDAAAAELAGVGVRARRRGRGSGTPELHGRRLRDGARRCHRARSSPRWSSFRTPTRRATSPRRSRHASTRPLVTDVTGIKKDGDRLIFVRPMFQGKLSADVAPSGPAPHLVTIQIGAFRADALARGGAAAPIDKAAVQIDAAKIRQKPEPPFKEAKQAVDLSQAARIVSVGRGIKGQENLKIAEQLAQALGAELAASRPICDAGWLPMERQIGSSGQTVAPKLYVALGISGAIQHLVGMKGSRTIVAINKDADAPIFEVADYGIVGDLFEVVPALIAELNKG